jgi:hypothetical protein
MPVLLIKEALMVFRITAGVFALAAFGSTIAAACCP